MSNEPFGELLLQAREASLTWQNNRVQAMASHNDEVIKK